MPIELDRLKSSLPDRYAIDSELGRGGMATVYLATDLKHDRRVAVKVLRPELASAIGWERFRREVRIAAPLNHPHILPVHDSGEVDGLLFYVMPLVEGESLKERLQRVGRLAPVEALKITREVISALSYAHAHGVVHRDIKPGNILLSAGEAVVADFGIAKALSEAGSDQMTQTGVALGSPAYMSPEQSRGEPEIDGRSDIYSLGCVLYEMLAGEPPFAGNTPLEMIARSLREEPPPLGSKVGGVPPSVEAAVHRALSKSPEDRYSTAREFGSALATGADTEELRTTPSGRQRMVAGIFLALAFVLALTLAWRFVGEPGKEAGGPTSLVSDIAVLPCSAVTPEDSGAARAITRMTALNLEGIPNLSEVPVHTGFRWWDAHHETPDRWSEAATALGAERVLRCTLVRTSPDRFEARFQLVDRSGNVQHAAVVGGPATSLPVGLADSLTLAIVDALRPAVVLSDFGYRALSGHHVEAIRALLAGEAAFQRGAWALAQRHYIDALSIDSSFVLARWRLADVRRWTITSTPADLRGLDSAAATQLGQVDRMLLQARLMGHSPQQLKAYEAIVREHPRDAYATLIYGDELFHRGPLWGIPLDSARTVLRRAAQIDTFLVPAFDHLVQADIQLGDRASARHALEHLFSISAIPPEVDIYLPALWQQAYLERFEPEAAAARRSEVFRVATPPDRQATALAARRGLSLDLAVTEEALGTMLVEAEEGYASERVTGRVAQGLAAFAMGRPQQALSRFDAAARIGSEEAKFQAAQWRVLPEALGLAGTTKAERTTGRNALEAVAASAGPDADTGRAVRAAWTLGLSELRAGDTLAARGRASHLRSLASQTGYAGMATLLDAALEASTGRHDAALTTSAPLLRYDSLGKMDRPFARSAVHLLRAEWHQRIGDLPAAASELMWHENEDLEGLPGGAAQAAEVDWAVGTFARLHRARIAIAMNNPGGACRHASDVARLWNRPESALEPLAQEARRLRDEACGH
jgi:tRNA A-37 threonylcarbamoyl transferase component Bud32/tetratricopeptide (TPR) repeat protein